MFVNAVRYAARFELQGCVKRLFSTTDERIAALAGTTLKEQSDPSTVTAPKGMSCVNSFHALWIRAPLAKGLEQFSYATRMRMDNDGYSAEKIAELFRDATDFYEVWGREMGVSFKEYPKICGETYNRRFANDDAVNEALLAYDKTPSAERIDKNDAYKFAELTKFLK